MLLISIVIQSNILLCSIAANRQSGQSSIDTVGNVDI